MCFSGRRERSQRTRKFLQHSSVVELVSSFQSTHGVFEYYCFKQLFLYHYYHLDLYFSFIISTQFCLLDVHNDNEVFLHQHRRHHCFKIYTPFPHDSNRIEGSDFNSSYCADETSNSSVSSLAAERHPLNRGEPLVKYAELQPQSLSFIWQLYRRFVRSQ